MANYLGLTDDELARFWAIRLGNELTAEERAAIRRADDKHLAEDLAYALATGSTRQRNACFQRPLRRKQRAARAAQQEAA